MDNDTLKKIYSYPIYDQNDSNVVTQIEAEIINILDEDKNHILTLYSEQKVQANRYLIHVTAVDSNLNIKWQKFVVSFNDIYTPYTMTRLPNNGVTVVGTETINMQVMKPLIFSLDSTGNLAPLSLQEPTGSNTISLTVYPNPTAKSINFHFDNLLNGTIKIINMDGKVLMVKEIEYPNTKVDMQHLASGVYFYNIISNNEKILSKRVVKID